MQLAEKLPLNWVIEPLSEVCSIERGIAFPSSAKKDATTPETIACLRTTNVQEDVDWNDLIFVAKTYVDSSNKMIRRGDILISMANSLPLVGKVSYVDEVQQESTFGGFISVIRAGEFLDPFFLYSYVSSSIIQAILRSWASQTTNIANLATTDLARLPLPLPSLPEQRRIGDILRQADELRHLRRQANERAKDLLPALFYEMFGDSTEPQRYESISLEQVADVVSGVAKGRRLPPQKTITVPYLRVANVQAGHLDLSEIKFIEALPSEVEQYRLVKDDILLTEGGDFDKLGRGALWDYDIPDCIHQNHIFRVRLDQGRVRPRFFEQFLQTPFVKAYFLRAAKRTTNIASINLTQLKALPVPIVDLGRQDEFVKRVFQLRLARSLQDDAEAKLGQLFQSLLARAFTGELTVAWRAAHAEELAAAAEERDRLLGIEEEPPFTIDPQTGKVSAVHSKALSQFVAVQLSPAVDRLLDGLASQQFLQVVVQEALASIAASLQPVAQGYAQEVSQALSAGVSRLEEKSLAGLATAAQSLTESNAQPLAEAARQSINSFTLALAREIAIIAAQLHVAPEPEAPQARRAIRVALDPLTLTLLRAVEQQPLYFRADDLVTDGLDVVRVEEGLRVLSALGFVRQVEVRSRLLYRLIDSKQECVMSEGLTL